MKKAMKPSTRVGLASLVSFVFAVLSCIGCSIHEHHRWGQSQDSVTFLLAGGTYVSFLISVLTGGVFVFLLAKER